ncbi:hypothetical protein [Ferruginibacter sp. HRS2-29]|uniref:hypothetical protein n=1 Tax=Ferruginibacter sp. HRS2-29 TaxID=2487334 RepID=UPI0020CB7FB7|nr:hypothetical protein [Ferruginibacter sp. HRS2-29]MCP9750375.1 hypothetical protein [Ferruginibacter sp. HRS2-29]
MKLIEILNNRELSPAIWGMIFIGWIFTLKGTRQSFLGLLKLLFSKKILVVHLCLLLYSAIVILLLYKFKLWDFSQIKNSVVWIIFSAFPSLFKSQNVYSQPGYFKKEVKEIFGRTAIVEFFVNVYSFHFAIELFLVPFLFLIAGVFAYAKTDKKYKLAEKLLESVLFLIGLALILYAIFQLVFHFSSFATFSNLQDFVVPALFTLFFIPCLYFFSVIMAYESKFIHLDFIIQNNDVRKFAKVQALKRFKLNAQDLTRWSGFLSRQQRSTKEEILQSFEEFAMMKALEANPKIIKKEEGWSPYSAKDFLLSEGLVTKYYERIFEDEWSASTYHVAVDKEPMSNTISYFVKGDMIKATELKLMLNVTNPKQKSSANKKLLSCVNLLFEKAVGKPMPEKIFNAIKQERNIQMPLDYLELNLKKENWQNHPDKAYSISFTMRIKETITFNEQKEL